MLYYILKLEKYSSHGQLLLHRMELSDSGHPWWCFGALMMKGSYRYYLVSRQDGL